MADNDNNLVFTVSSDMSAAQRGLNKFTGDVDAATNKISRKFEALGNSIDKGVSSSLQQRINSMVGVGTTAAKQWSGALADQGKELDKLRAKYSPLFAVITQYKSNVEDIKRAHALGAISSNEYQAAMSKERQAALASTAAIKGRNAAISQAPAAGPSGASARPWQTGNIVSQFQDIGVSAFGGQKPLTIGLQQGTQLADAIQTFGSGKSAIAGLGAAFASLVSPVALVTIGLTAGAAALIQYFTSTKSESDKAAEAIKNHSELIRRIKDAWPEAEAGLKEYASESKKILTQDLQDNIKLYKSEIAKVSTDVKNLINPRFGGTGLRGPAGTVAEITAAVSTLSAGIKAGNPDLRQFVEQLVDIENQTGTPNNIKKIIDQMREAAKAGIDAQDKLDPLVKTIEGVGTAAAAQAKNIKAFTDAVDKLADIAPTPLTDSEKAQKIFDDAMRNAKTEADVQNATDQFNAANQRISDQNPIVDTGGGRFAQVPQPTPRPNIELEGLPGEVEKQEAAEKKAASAAEELKKKQDDLLRTAGDRIESVQLETSLVGKYGVAADNARFALETWQKAEKLNLNDDQKKALQEKIDQYSQLSDALSKVKLSQDLANQARFNSLSKEDQQVSTTLRQFGQDDSDLNSPQAQQIRKSLQAEDSRQEIVTFMSDFKNALVNNGDNIGKAFGEALKNALMKEADKIWDRLFNQLANAILGTGTSGTTAAGGGVAGIGVAAVGKLFGGSAPTGAAPVGAVTRAALPAAIPSTDVASYITQAAIKRGIDPVTALAVAKSEGGLSSWNMQSGVFKNGVQEPSFGPFQLYKGGGLGNAFQKQTGLDPALAANGPAGVDFALDYAKKNGWGSWYGARNTGISNWQGIGTGGENDASKALDKLAGSAGTATQGLGQLGNGFSQVGNSLSTGAASAASGGGGGIFGWLGNLFGGSKGFNLGAGATGPTSGFDPFSALPVGFADGGYTGPGGKNTPAGIVHAGEFVVPKHIVDKIGVPALSTMMKGYANGGLVTPALVSAPRAPELRPSMAATGDRSGQPGVLNVHINGANGDDHVRELVKQGVSAGLGQYNDSQVRGGFGSNQNKWNARKG